MRIIEARAAKFNFSMVKPCDYCKSSPALLYCKADSAFTCIACDAKLHHHYGGDNLAPPHERVWMCEVCEQAPAAFTCKADAAALCVACDRDIHSANPLAGRHERVPVVPFYDTAESIVMMKPAVVMDCDNNDMSSVITVHHDNKFPVDNDSHDLKSLEFLFSDADQILDFESYQQQPFSDSVVPVQTNSFKPAPIIPAHRQLAHNDDYHSLSEARFEIDFTRSKVNSFNNNTTASLSHSVSSSSMDVGVVPDGISTISDRSYPLESSTASDGQNMDREARVLRYREKRKNRKFEKTIRYASRKAYAETRPRIKGRFAKRTDSDTDLDRIFSGHFIADARYGVVPSF